VPAEGELRLDPLFSCQEAQLLEPVDLDAGELLVGDVGQRRAAPESQRTVECEECSGVFASGVPAPALAEESLEPKRVDLLGLALEDIAAASRVQRLVRRKGLAQPRDLDVEAVSGGPGRSIGPERVDEPVSRDDFVRVEEQEGQEGAGLRATQRERAAVPEGFDRPQNAELRKYPLQLVPNDDATTRPRARRERFESRV
jgi:hypothetical protein